MAAKRSSEESGFSGSSAGPSKRSKCCELDVSDICESSSSAIVHGVCVSLSPVKSCKNKPDKSYFDGRFSDGKKCVRIVSFDPKQHERLMQMSQSTRKPVALKECVIQESIYDKKLEVKILPQTRIISSPKKMEVGDKDSYEPGCLEMSSLGNMGSVSLNDMVICSGKVVKVEKPCQVMSRGQDKKQLTKQDCTFADAKGSVRIVLWEGDVGRLDSGKSYKISKMKVRMFDGIKYLSLAQDAVVDEIPDIGLVATGDVGGAGFNKEICGNVIGLQGIEEYQSCILCNAKIEPTLGGSGQCTKCLAMLQLSACNDQVVARLIVKGVDEKVYRLTAFKKEITLICQDSEEIQWEKKLLSMSNVKMKFIVNQRDIITDVERL